MPGIVWIGTNEVPSSLLKMAVHNQKKSDRTNSSAGKESEIKGLECSVTLAKGRWRQEDQEVKIKR